jgi:LuxR family transcriptional regulator
MTTETETAHLLAAIRQAAPAGFAIALHIRFTAPRYLFQAYPREWIELYSREGLVLQDPTVRWGFAHTGTVRWSALAGDDPRGVLARAAGHGLRYGFTAATDAGGSRSVASFARGDREFDDGEIAAIAALLAELHDRTLTAETLSPADHEALKRMSVLLTHS